MSTNSFQSKTSASNATKKRVLAPTTPATAGEDPLQAGNESMKSSFSKAHQSLAFNRGSKFESSNRSLNPAEGKKTKTIYVENAERDDAKGKNEPSVKRRQAKVSVDVGSIDIKKQRVDEKGAEVPDSLERVSQDLGS